MKNLKKVSLLASVGMLLAAPAMAGQADYRDVVKNTYGNIAHSSNGNCVYTRWQSDMDECIGKYDIRSRLTVEQRTVFFDFNKSTLNSNEKVKLDEVSRIIIESDEVESVDIVGYADVIGKPSYNKRLSMKRANTVKSYLANRGLRTRNVSVEGMGETNAYTNCSESLERNALIACLAADRRVEIKLNVKQ